MSFQYVIQNQDCLSSIAETYGFSDFQTIYQHPANAGFRQKRPNPNIICPGDKLFIPDIETQEHEAGTGKLHKYQANLPKVMLRLCIKDDLHEPYRGAKYRMSVGFETFEGVTDGRGVVEQKIPPASMAGEITIFPEGCDPDGGGYTFDLLLGDLDPVAETTGVDARLSNLGFVTFEESGNRELSHEARSEAIQAFQNKFGLEATGELNEDTKNALRKLHDGE